MREPVNQFSTSGATGSVSLVQAARAALLRLKLRTTPNKKRGNKIYAHLFFAQGRAGYRGQLADMNGRALKTKRHPRQDGGS